MSTQLTSGDTPNLRSATPTACDVAIVGMSCLFPESPNLRRYWQTILHRIDCIREVPDTRWDSHHYFDEDRFARDKVYSKWGGFLGSIRFDPMKWKIPPASVLSIDPIQLLSLEVASQAFEDAGYHQREFPRERTGVIFACAGSHDVGSDYAFRTMLQHYLPRVKDLTPELRDQITENINATLPEWTEDSFPGFLMNVIAGRIANRFDLGGPNYVVDAACAASLAALHASLAQLRLGTVDAMLVGAADGTNNPFCYMSFAKTHALSPRGRSRPFDNSADGIALGEGIAAVVLRRLADAERDGDKIYAVIKGIGASSDGRNRSMTAPHPPGQILAMQRAYEDARVPAASVSLVEAHGTGTAVGDSTEITSLHTLFSQATQDQQYAAVGSVKSQIGHTKTCAGLASLVKTTLAIKHRVLPPTINVETPNQNVDFRHSPFFINTETRPWFEELGEHPRRAGVSAFGFGGTNFHVVLEEYTGTGASKFDLDLSPRAAEVFLWRRGTRAEIVAVLEALQAQLEQTPTDDLAQLACAIHHDEALQKPRATQRTGYPDPWVRLGIVAGSVEELKVRVAKAIEALQSKDALQDPAGIYYSEAAPIAPQNVAFLYPGQGSQAVNMLRDLVVVNPWAHELFTTTNRALGEFFPTALTRTIFPPPAFTPEEAEERKQKLNDTQVAQPALGLMEVFGTRLLARYGVVPGAVAGHSYGEYVALAAAGCMTTAELTNVSAHRGRVAADASQSAPGAMAAVQAGAVETGTALADLNIPAELANLNAPDQTIVAGSVEAIARAAAELTARGLRTKRIPVTAAFHTSALAPASKTLGLVLEHINFLSPKIPVYSNTLADRYPTDPDAMRGLLERHICEPVRFQDQIRKMRADGVEVFVEVGPGRVLTGLVGRILGGEAVKTLTLDASGRDGVLQFGHLLAQAFAWGLPVELSAWFESRALKNVGSAEHFDRVRRESQPQKSDWTLWVNKSVPVTPLPARKGQPGDGLRAKFGGKTATSHVANAPVVKDASTHSNGSSRTVDTKPQTVTVAEAAQSSGSSAPKVPSVSRNVAVVERVLGSSATVDPAPAPLPVAPATRYPHASATNGAARANSQHEHRANGNLASHAQPASNGAHHSTSATAAPLAGAPIAGDKHDSAFPGGMAPLAPCLPLITDAQGFSTSFSPHMRFAVSNNNTQLQESAHAMTVPVAQMILQSQALMMQMLDLQKWQQQVALRFVETHQQMLQSCAQGGYVPMLLPNLAAMMPVPEAAPAAAPIPAVAPVAAPAPAVAIAEPARTAPAPHAVVARPVAVIPKPVTAVNRLAAAPVPAVRSAVAVPAAEPAINRNGNGHSHGSANGVHPREIPAPHRLPATTVAGGSAPAEDGNIPTTDTFKADLLQAVSERTGYPIEMLDLELPMESGLGIDSIKTVEIFSNLKEYHQHFRQEDQDEEEVLKEFTKLKTLGDIVSAYELRYQALTSGGDKSAKARDNGAIVERYTLEAVAAMPSSSEKKTTLASR